jgi:WhiB family redox-sensing transcriptional regulator
MGGPLAIGPRRVAAGRVASAPDWRAKAACHGAADLFYQSNLEGKQATDHRVSRAKAVCVQCPVRPQCAAYALRVAEPYGIWGGFTERERMLLRETDWRHCANHRCSWVDLTQLEARLREIKALNPTSTPVVSRP